MQPQSPGDPPRDHSDQPRGIAAPAEQWPALAADQGEPSGPAPQAGNEFDLAQTIARVGDQHIFRGDLVGDANLMLASYLERLPPEQVEQSRAQIEAQREKLVQQLLPQVISRKLLYLEFLRNIPADKREEIQEKIDTQIGEAFEKHLFEMLDKLEKADEEDKKELAKQDAQLFRLAVLMDKQGMTSLGQLEKYLRRYGSSLKSQVQAFTERALGQQQMREQVAFNPEVTHQEMLQYYRENISEFERPTRARWQQITVRFNQFPSKVEAGEAIAKLGNELVVGGTPFWAVAKRSSQGPNAEEGGVHDWTEWGDLEVSREINRAVFSLPVGKLSHLIEDQEGLHIIRVLDREQAQTVPFTEAQLEIKKKIQDEKRQESLKAYMEELREKTLVRTIYDESSDGERLAEPAGAGDRFPR